MILPSDDQVRTLIENIYNTLTFQKADLISRTDWGVVNFKAAEIEINQVFETLNVLKELPLGQLPKTTFERLQNNLIELNQLFVAINNFDINQPNHISTRDNLATEIKQKGEAFYFNIAVWIPYLVYLKGDYQRILDDMNTSLVNTKNLMLDVKSTSEKLIEESKKESEQTKKEIDDILASSRKASAQIGVTVFTTDFSQEATDLSKNARKWLIATISLALLALGGAVYSWFYVLPPESTNYQILYKLGSKITILAILFTATIWSGRIYKALRHQSAVNRHRALSLNTFQAFTNATTDEGTKNAVLLEATKTIFGTASTGYLDQKDESSESSIKIIEVVKSLLIPPKNQ